MAQYKIGSVNVTNGSATVTGVDTLWSSEISAGDIFTVVGDNAWYEVGSVGSNTSITLTSSYSGTTASGAQYAISRDFTTNKSIPYPQKGDIETASLLKRAMNIIDTELSTGFDSSNVTITGGTINGTAIGGTTAAAASVTTLTTSSTVTLNGGTANGVPYLNGSKVLTTGSALTFDGTKFVVGSSSTASVLTAEFTKGAADPSFTLGFRNGSGASASTEQAVLSFNYGGTQIAGVGFVRGGGANAEAITFGLSSEQMRLTSTGLGIGTSSPGYKLDVNGATQITSSSGTNLRLYTASGAPLIQFYPNAAGGRAQTIYSTDSSSGLGGGLFVIEDTTSSNRLVFAGASGNLGLGVTPSAFSGGKAIEIGAAGNAFNGYEASNILISSGAYYNGGWKYANSSYGASVYQQYRGTHNWQIAPSGTAGDAISLTQALTLDSSGRLLLGGTTADNSAFFELFYNGLAYNGIVTKDSSSSSTTYSNVFVKNGSVVGSIAQTTVLTTYNTTSDYRLKTLVAPITGSGERLDALNPVEFDWNVNGQRDRGFFAHQFQAVYPNSVTGTKDAVDAEGKPVYQSMQASSSEVIADLVAEIKSLRKRVAQLEQA